MTPAAPPGLRLAVVTDARAGASGWHESRLASAARVRGADVRFLSLRDCAMALTADTPLGLRMPGFEDRLPDGVFVRSIPAGTFEQVTLRLSILHALAECGVPVHNDARAIERSVDKSMMSFLLARAGVPSLPTWVCESPDTARRLVRIATQDRERIVLKPLFGSQGKGLRRLNCAAELPEADQCSGVYYLQTFVSAAGPGARDWRVFVVADQALAAMERRADDWVTNRCRGGQCYPAACDGELGALAVAALRAVGASYGGVDIIRDREGTLRVLEVNGVPAWKGLQQVCETDIAQALIDQLVARACWSERDVSAAPRPAPTVATAIRAACRAELEALKPGNVGMHGDGHGMCTADFLASAECLAEVFARPGLGVGERVLESVRRTRNRVGCNTNLGIVLLCAPLAAAYELRPAGTLRRRLASVLEALDRGDAEAVFEAIRIANPGGLGRSSQHDVSAPPQVTLLEAMRFAEQRDRIAFQYSHGFEDLFTLGLPILERDLGRWSSLSWALSSVFLNYLCAFDDSHVVRKHGSECAAVVRHQAGALRDMLQSARRPDTVVGALLDFDQSLKRRGINPGTSADLTVATAFARSLSILS